MTTPDPGAMRSHDAWDESSTDLTMPVTQVYSNTQQEVIFVTVDKAKLCLTKNVEKMGRRDRWMVPLGILVTLILGLAASNFTARFGVSADGWTMAFVMLTIGSTIWLFVELVKRADAVTVDQVLEELKQDQEARAGSPDPT